MPQRRYGRFQVWVYTRNERGHRPYVHVFVAEGEITIFIDDVIEVRSIFNISRVDARKALEIVRKHSSELRDLWSQYNG